MILAAVGFLLPQEVPLEWYPLNNPGTDINYLEISCAADATGDVQIYYDTTLGINELNSIKWPISPTTQTYTYTFPLPDAPITEIRVDPLSQGGTLNIRQMRIINRRNEEIRRFTRDLFRPQHEIAAINATPEGWNLISTPKATDPYARIEMFSPIVPVGMNHRNLLRCLLSTGYLTLMLWILLLAVLFVFYRPRGWRDLFVHLGFMAFIAALFACVGNRGLIRNSIHYARYVPPPVPPGLKLEFDLLSGGPGNAQLFWDSGEGMSEASSLRKAYESHIGLQVLSFDLPAKGLKALRFDPRDGQGRLEIRGIRVIDAGQRTRAVLPLDSLQAVHDIARLEAGPDSLAIDVLPGRNDPVTVFTPASVALINRAAQRP